MIFGGVDVIGLMFSHCIALEKGHARGKQCTIAIDGFKKDMFYDRRVRNEKTKI